jgi:PDZ domain-containing secreted protein
MRVIGFVGIMAAALLAAAAAQAATDEPNIQMKVEIAGGQGSLQPQVRIWVNGKEVKPGEAINLEESGGGRAEKRARPSERRSEGGETRAAQAWLGVGVSPAPEGTDNQGLKVTVVTPESPAAEVGLAVGDVITSVDGSRVAGPEQFVETIQRHKPGDRISLTWEHNGQSVTRRVALGSRPEGMPSGARPPDEERPRQDRPAEGYLGVMAAPLSEDIQEVAGIDRGVLINSLMDNSPAAEAGLLPGDVITAVGGKRVNAPEELTDLIRSHKPGDTVPIEYYRSGKKREADVKLGQRPAGPRDREGFGFSQIPDRLYEQFPKLREYLRGLGRWFEDGRRGRDEARSGEPLSPGAVPDLPAPPAPPRMEPYGVGKDIGQILERLDRLDRRLGDIERRLDRLEKR